jgi:5-bromo-4-chloroindolyl phosphate hydrolysis protein
MLGTNLWGILFVVLVLIGFVFVVKQLIGLWTVYFRRLAAQNDIKGEVPSWTLPTVLTILIVGTLIAFATVGWSIVIGITANSSSYENPAELAAKEKILQSKAPTNEEIDAAKNDLKSRAEEKPHADALSSFDKAMKNEAEKIRQRNQKEDGK